jgi:hypothetical protein
MSPGRPLVVIAIAASILGGCRLGETDVLAGSDPVDADVVFDSPFEAEGSSFDGGIELSGTWAQLLTYGAVFNLPAIGQTEGETLSILHVTITMEEGSPRLVSRTCSVEIDNGTDIIETIIPDRFVSSLVLQEPEATWQLDGSVMRYGQAKELTLRGVVLGDPVIETLPVEATDPRVFDQDEDGNPGMTVLIKGITDGEVYVIQRDWYALDGEVTGPDWIDGLATWSTEQVVLGSDNPILNMQTESTAHPDPKRSNFRMTRVADDADCAWILSERDAVFAR